MKDDSKNKLLKLQKALLKALTIEKEKNAVGTFAYEQIEAKLNDCLNKYKELVTSIDSDIYNELKNKIASIDNLNLTSEEELKSLEELEVFYNQLYAIQNKFKSSYNEYSSVPLELSNLDTLNIKKYLKRKNNLKDFFIATKDIERCKEDLETANNELYKEEQKENFVMDLVKQLDDELKEKFNSSEGRIQDPNGKLSYTSIVSEYNNLGYKLTPLSYEGKDLSKIEEEVAEAKEKLAVATISFEALPSADNRTILETIKKENNEANYQLTLAKIIKEVYNGSKTYEEAINKRQKLNDLLKYRNEYLISLGIKYGIDPFTRLAINLQLNKLEGLQFNETKIDYLRKKIAHLNTTIEHLEYSKEEYERLLNNEIKLPSSKEEIPLFDINVSNDNITFEDNQVKSKRNPKHPLNIRRCHEKSRNVLKRVYELITKKDEEIIKDVNPELTISSIPKEQEDLFKEFDNEEYFENAPQEVLFEEIDPLKEDFPEEDIFKTMEPIKEDNLFEEMEPLKEDFPEEDIFKTMEPIKEDNLFEEMEPLKEDFPEEDIFKTMEPIKEDNLFEEIDPLKEEFAEEDIFMDSEPFTSPIIFNDRVDNEDNINTQSNPTNEPLEEDFWSTFDNSPKSIRR